VAGQEEAAPIVDVALRDDQISYDGNHADDMNHQLLPAREQANKQCPE
jgi:hypothetical protein